MGLADFWDDSEDSDVGGENSGDGRGGVEDLNANDGSADKGPEGICNPESDEPHLSVELPSEDIEPPQSVETPSNIETSQSGDPPSNIEVPPRVEQHATPDGSQWNIIRDLCMEQLVDIDAGKYATWPLYLRERLQRLVDEARPPPPPKDDFLCTFCGNERSLPRGRLRPPSSSRGRRPANSTFGSVVQPPFQTATSDGAMRWQPFQSQPPPLTSQTRVLKHVNGERFVQFDGPKSPKPTRKAKAAEEPPAPTELESLRTRCSKMGAAGAALRLQLSQAREETAQARRDVAKAAAAFELERATMKKEAEIAASHLQEAMVRHQADAETIAKLKGQLGASKAAAVGTEGPAPAAAGAAAAEKARHVSFAAAPPVPEESAKAPVVSQECVPESELAAATDVVDDAVVV